MGLIWFTRVIGRGNKKGPGLVSGWPRAGLGPLTPVNVFEVRGRLLIKETLGCAKNFLGTKTVLPFIV